MQGTPLDWHEEPFCELLKEGVPSVPPGSLVRVLKCIHGLTDARFVWNRHLDKELRLSGYRQSLLDPCLYFLHEHEDSAALLD